MALMKYVYQQTVTYTALIADYDDEEGVVITPDEQDTLALSWVEQAMPIEYYPEDFMTVEQGPLLKVSQEVVFEEHPPDA
jgi:hypothetical protein